jgi:hypothetical protein
MQCDDREPELITAFEYQHHHIAMSDPQGLEIRSRLVRIPFQVGKRKINMLSMIVCPT